MNIFGYNFDHTKNSSEVNETASRIVGKEQMEFRGKWQFSKAYINKNMNDKKESIAERILKNRRNNM